MADEWGAPEASDTPRSPEGLDKLVARIQRLEREVRDAKNQVLRAAGIGVDEDGMTVDSSLNVTGDLDVTGTTELGGPTTISGNTDVSGTVNINDGGFLRVRYPASMGGGTAVFFGRLVSETDASYLGTGILIQGQDSTANILSARTNVSGTAHSVSVYDNQQNIVVGVHDTSARGLSRPTFDISVPPDDYTKWGATTSTSWARVAQGYGNLWHSNVSCAVRAVAHAGATAGQVRVMVRPSGGTEVQVGSIESIDTAIAFRIIAGEMPSSIAIGDAFYITLEARVTAGSGSVSGAVIGASMRSY